jgi:hypothetical protein
MRRRAVLVREECHLPRHRLQGRPLRAKRILLLALHQRPAAATRHPAAQAPAPAWQAHRAPAAAPGASPCRQPSHQAAAGPVPVHPTAARDRAIR